MTLASRVKVRDPSLVARAHHDAPRDHPMAQCPLGVVVGERPLGILQHPEDGLPVTPQFHSQGARLGMPVPEQIAATGSCR